MNLENLSQVLANQPSFRYKQIHKLIYQDLIDDWQLATVLSKDLRQALQDTCSLDIVAKDYQLADGSSKAVFTLKDHKKVEGVLIKNSDGRHTVCVSSQVGCPMGCKFCATGAMGFIRNLSDNEIVEQVLYFARILKAKGKKVDNVVFMGMGEPMLNIDNVLTAIKTLNDEEKFHLGSRRISISTIGIKAGIEKIIQSGLQVNLAISLHASNDVLRSKLMPANKNTSIKKLLEIADDYIAKTNRQLMFEYILLKDVNDSREDAEQLAKLMAKPLYLVNLIMYNDTGVFKATTSAKLNTFSNILKRHRVKVTIRDSRGGEIKAACGQLAIEK